MNYLKYKLLHTARQLKYKRIASGVPPLTLQNAIAGILLNYQIYGNSVQGELPDGYTQLEYIESTGTQYIDTDYIANPTTELYTEIMPTQATPPSVTAFFGYLNGSNPYNRFQLQYNKNGIYLSRGLNEKGISATLIEQNEKFKFSSTPEKTLVLDDVEYTGLSNAFPDNIESKSMIIFARQSTNVERFAQMRCYKFIISEEGKEIHNFITCKDLSGTIGMYDTVTNTFYTNSGTGEFIAGPAIPNPDNPIEIESVGDMVTDSSIYYRKYKIPVTVNNQTTNIYLDEPLRKIGNYADYVDYETQKVVRNVDVIDDTGTVPIEQSLQPLPIPTEKTIDLPDIAVSDGTNIIDVDTTVTPSDVEVAYYSKEKE